MKTTKLKVTGMHCPSCEKLITYCLEDLEGIESSEVSCDNNEVNVTYNEKEVDEEEIKKEIVKEGYKVE